MIKLTYIIRVAQEATVAAPLYYTDIAELVDVVLHDSGDSNSGLPDWYFEASDLFAFEAQYHLDRSVTIEWWPGVGPAPHWSRRFSPQERAQTDFWQKHVLPHWTRWHRETYGC